MGSHGEIPVSPHRKGGRDKEEREMLTKQQKYNMDIKDIAKEIRSKLKKEFSSCSFSVTIERYSMGQSMSIALMSAPFEAFIWQAREDKKQYAQINHLWPGSYEEHLEGKFYHLTPEAWHCVKRIAEITNYYNFDDSDRQTDYFDVNFSLDINIGKWNKPFVKKGYIQPAPAITHELKDIMEA